MPTRAEPTIREEYIRYLNGRNDTEDHRKNFCFTGGAPASVRVKKLADLDLEMSAMPL